MHRTGQPLRGGTNGGFRAPNLEILRPLWVENSRSRCSGAVVRRVRPAGSLRIAGDNEPEGLFQALNTSS